MGAKTALGLPRMRGDRPQLLLFTGDGAGATPHARGSTPQMDSDRHRARGYPACAGIDLHDQEQRIAELGLPRMRGDRPLKLEHERLRQEATPHARGSTSRLPASSPITPGYPACAGIDLERLSDWPRSGRLPRMRGDRPHAELLLYLTEQTTPHARGSTPPIVPPRWHPPGYPACAGIDPCPDLRIWQMLWLPRMRGDRPVIKGFGILAGLATPHARGSTRC